MNKRNNYKWLFLFFSGQVGVVLLRPLTGRIAKP